jgi:phosphate starvation-inducible protein PhoH
MASKPKHSKTESTNKHTKALPDPIPIVAKTSNQDAAIKSFKEGKQLILHGLAGTGKTFVACSLAIQDIWKGKHDRLVIYRSAVPTRDMGFMPGTKAEKEAPYEAPYRSIFAEMFRRGDAYELMKKNGTVEFSTSSYIRGLTLRDTVVLVDECQNWTLHELDSLITRLGDGCRVIFCGDYTQTDLTRNVDKEGLSHFLKIAKSMDEFSFVEFGIDDIVRSDLVKSYIIAKARINGS